MTPHPDTTEHSGYSTCFDSDGLPPSVFLFNLVLTPLPEDGVFLIVVFTPP